MHNEKPPCWKCLPKLFAENEIPAAIFQRVRGQHIMGMGGPVDIRHDVLFYWIDRYRVDDDDKDWCFDLVNQAYHNMLANMRNRADKK